MAPTASMIVASLLLASSLASFFVRVDAVSTAAPKARKINCNNKHACFPWDPRGPRCGRGNPINLRFILDVAPENWRVNEADNTTQSQVLYAFCPVVDELQAFNLSGAIPLAGLHSELSVDADNNVIATPKLSVQQEGIAYLSVFGMGNLDNYAYPSYDTSYGSVGIIFNTTTKCGEGEFGIVTFLVLNISLEQGLFKYYQDFQLPTGTGFAPTCDASNVCLMDPSLKCFGEDGKMNCGTCSKDPAKMRLSKLQVWTSYYGTDAFNKRMTSGGSNPLNYREFSGGGVFSSMMTAYEQVQSGELVTTDDVTPTVGE